MNEGGCDRTGELVAKAKLVTSGFAWHDDGSLCLGDECGIVDALGDHPPSITVNPAEAPGDAEVYGQRVGDEV